MFSGNKEEIILKKEIVVKKSDSMRKTLEEKLRSSKLLSGENIQRVFRSTGDYASKVFLTSDEGNIFIKENNGFSFASGERVDEYIDKKVVKNAMKNPSLRVLEEIAQSVNQSIIPQMGFLYEQQLEKVVKKSSFGMLPVQFEEFVKPHLKSYTKPVSNDFFGNASLEVYKLDDVMYRPQKMNNEEVKELHKISRRAKRAARILRRKGINEPESMSSSFSYSSREKGLIQDLVDAKKVLQQYKVGFSCSGEESPEEFIKNVGIPSDMVIDRQAKENNSSFELTHGKLDVHVEYEQKEVEKKKNSIGGFVLAGVAGIASIMGIQYAINNQETKVLDNETSISNKESLIEKSSVPFEENPFYETVIVKEHDSFWGLAKERHPGKMNDELTKIVDEYAVDNGKISLTEYYKRRDSGKTIDDAINPNHIVCGDTVQLPDYSSEKLQSIVQLKNDKYSLQEIVEETGIKSTDTVVDMLKNYQLKFQGESPIIDRFDKKVASEVLISSVVSSYASGNGSLSDIRNDAKERFGMDISESTISSYARKELGVSSRKQAIEIYKQVSGQEI